MRTMTMLLLLTAAARADQRAVEGAYRLCQMIDATGLTSAECEVSGWSSTVTTTIDMNSGEARDLCGKLAQHVRSERMGFDGEWTLQIRSPYSGENNIAFCTLP